MDDASVAAETDKTVWGKHTYVTKRRHSDRWPLEITWRGKVFEWEGRRHRWAHRTENGVWWTLSTVYLEQAGFRNEAGDDPKFLFGEVRWLSHCPGVGDGAERRDAEEALEASLEYAIRHHTRVLHSLRVLAGVI